MQVLGYNGESKMKRSEKEGKRSSGTGMSLRQAASVLGHAGARCGGKARIAALTPEERENLARRAAEARWAKDRAARGIRCKS